MARNPTMNRMHRLLYVLSGVILAGRLCYASDVAPGASQEVAGASLFKANCSACHEGGDPRAPAAFAMYFMSPEKIYSVITDGPMKAMAQNISQEERRVLAEFLSQKKFGQVAAAPPPTKCKTDRQKPWFDYRRHPLASGWGMNNLENTRFIPQAIAKLQASDVPKLKLRWAFAFPGATRARAQVAVAGGALFVGSHDGTVFALDAKSGCMHWSLATGTEVRTAMSISDWQEGQAGSVKRRPTLYFGDQAAYAYAVNALTGEILWKVKADDQPAAIISGSPTLYRDHLYVPISSIEETLAGNPKHPCCTFRGSVVALNASSGDKVWQAYTIPLPPKEQGKNVIGTPLYGPAGAAVYSAPTIDIKRQRLYVGSDNNYSSPPDENSSAIFSIDLRDGTIAWRKQMIPGNTYNVSCRRNKENCPKEYGDHVKFGYAGPPSLLNIDGKDILAAVQKGGWVWGLDPDSGELLWKSNIAPTSTIELNKAGPFGVAVEGNKVFATVFSNKDSRSETPYPGMDEPGLYALDAHDGHVLWKVGVAKQCRKNECRGYTAAPTVIPGVVFAAANGFLQAFDTANGKLLWESDTNREFATLNGAMARGGSIEGSGPVIADGMLYQSSGYDYAHGATPGGVLLAFSVDKK